MVPLERDAVIFPSEENPAPLSASLFAATQRNHARSASERLFEEHMLAP